MDAELKNLQIDRNKRRSAEPSKWATRWIITGGGLSSGASSEAAHAGKIGDQILGAAYNAFGTGLHLALHISAALLLSGAVVTVLTLHRDKGERYEP